MLILLFITIIKLIRIDYFPVKIRSNRNRYSNFYTKRIKYLNNKNIKNNNFYKNKMRNNNKNKNRIKIGMNNNY